MATLEVIGIIGAFFGILGAALLAIHNRYSRWGWVAYVVSNFAWIFYGTKTDASPLVVQMGFFTLISFVGIYRWFVVTHPNEKGL
jgi:nicotinamide riboside transporter PnuC